MTQPILTNVCNDFPLEYLVGEEIFPGYVRIIGANEPGLQSLITARPEFNIWKLDGGTIVQDDAEPIESDPHDDEVSVELLEARAEYAQRNDLYLTGMGG